jgi:hypothetical protein
MLLGAGIWASTGTDLDRALVTGTMADYLGAAARHRTALIANLSLWIAGALGLGAAGAAMAALTADPTRRHFVTLAYGTGVPLAISAFMAWLAVIVQGPPDPGPTELAVANVVGWYAYRADAVATALLIGAGPAAVSLAGRDSWVPAWLFGWGLLAALAGVLSFVPYFAPAVPLGVAFVIVPIGIGWTLAASFVLLRLDR